MTDSRSGANLDPEHVARKIDRLRNLPKKDWNLVTEIAQLPYWVKLALARMVVTGCTIGDALKGIGRPINPKTKKASGWHTISNYRRTEAGKKYMAALEEQVRDRTPAEIVSDVVQGALTGAMLDKLSALEMAKASQDYAMVDKIATSLLAIGGVTEKKRDVDVRPQIVLQLAGGEEIPIIRSEAKRITAPAVDYEIVDD